MPAVSSPSLTSVTAAIQNDSAIHTEAQNRRVNLERGVSERPATNRSRDVETKVTRKCVACVQDVRASWPAVEAWRHWASATKETSQSNPKAWEADVILERQLDQTIEKCVEALAGIVRDCSFFHTSWPRECDVRGPCCCDVVLRAWRQIGRELYDRYGARGNLPPIIVRPPPSFSALFSPPSPGQRDELSSESSGGPDAASVITSAPAVSSQAQDSDCGEQKEEKETTDDATVVGEVDGGGGGGASGVTHAAVNLGRVTIEKASLARSSEEKVATFPDGNVDPGADLTERRVGRAAEINAGLCAATLAQGSAPSEREALAERDDDSPVGGSTTPCALSESIDNGSASDRCPTVDGGEDGDGASDSGSERTESEVEGEIVDARLDDDDEPDVAVSSSNENSCDGSGYGNDNDRSASDRMLSPGRPPASSPRATMCLSSTPTFFAKFGSGVGETLSSVRVASGQQWMGVGDARGKSVESTGRAAAEVAAAETTTGQEPAEAQRGPRVACCFCQKKRKRCVVSAGETRCEHCIQRDVTCVFRPTKKSQPKRPKRRRVPCPEPPVQDGRSRDDRDGTHDAQLLQARCHREGCPRPAAHGPRGKRALWCQLHYVSQDSRRPLGCAALTKSGESAGILSCWKDTTWAWPGHPPTRCDGHKKGGMVDVVRLFKDRFAEVVWPKLAEAGWWIDRSSRSNYTTWMPPNVVRGNPAFRSRVHYFDTRSLVVKHCLRSEQHYGWIIKYLTELGTQSVSVEDSAEASEPSVGAEASLTAQRIDRPRSPGGKIGFPRRSKHQHQQQQQQRWPQQQQQQLDKSRPAAAAFTHQLFSVDTSSSTTTTTTTQTTTTATRRRNANDGAGAWVDVDAAIRGGKSSIDLAEPPLSSSVPRTVRGGLVRPRREHSIPRSRQREPTPPRPSREFPWQRAARLRAQGDNPAGVTRAGQAKSDRAVTGFLRRMGAFGAVGGDSDPAAALVRSLRGFDGLVCALGQKEVAAPAGDAVNEVSGDPGRVLDRAELERSKGRSREGSGKIAGISGGGESAVSSLLPSDDVTAKPVAGSGSSRASQETRPAQAVGAGLGTDAAQDPPVVAGRHPVRESRPPPSMTEPPPAGCAVDEDKGLSSRQGGMLSQLDLGMCGGAADGGSRCAEVPGQSIRAPVTHSAAATPRVGPSNVEPALPPPPPKATTTPESVVDKAPRDGNSSGELARSRSLEVDLAGKILGVGDKAEERLAATGRSASAAADDKDKEVTVSRQKDDENSRNEDGVGEATKGGGGEEDDDQVRLDSPGKRKAGCLKATRGTVAESAACATADTNSSGGTSSPVRKAGSSALAIACRRLSRENDRLLSERAGGGGGGGGGRKASSKRRAGASGAAVKEAAVSSSSCSGGNGWLRGPGREGGAGLLKIRIPVRRREGRGASSSSSSCSGVPAAPLP